MVSWETERQHLGTLCPCKLPLCLRGKPAARLSIHAVRNGSVNLWTQPQQLGHHKPACSNRTPTPAGCLTLHAQLGDAALDLGQVLREQGEGEPGAG